MEVEGGRVATFWFLLYAFQGFPMGPCYVPLLDLVGSVFGPMVFNGYMRLLD